MFLRKQSWRNSFALKRCGNWCGMRYEMRVFLSQSSRRWCEMMAFLRTLRNIGDVLGSALFFFIIVNSDYFYTQRFFYLLYVFKGAKLAKFIRYEAVGKLSLFFITKFTENRWNDCVFEGSKEHRRCSGKCTVFYLFLWILIIFIRKDFFIFFMFSREQSWRNSFAMKRCGNWCGMRYEMRVFLSQSSRRCCERMAFLRELRNIGDCKVVMLWCWNIFF